MSLVTLDSTLGDTLTAAQSAVGSGDPARVVLAVLAASGDTPSDAIRMWLRSRGNAEVRALASSAGSFRSLVESSERYLADYSPERVRERTAHRIVPALSLGLPAPEAALLAMVAIDMIRSGKDGTLLTRAFSVAMNSTQKSVTNRADSLASRGLLRIAVKRTGVPTRVRLRQSETIISNDQTAALIADLAAGTDSALTELFYAVTHPALAYSDLGYDAWYCSLLDALGIRKQLIPAARSSRTRKRMRELAGTDNLHDALRVLATDEVMQALDYAETERQIAATLRAESAAEHRARKQAGYGFVDDIAPLPRRGARDISGWLAETRETADALDAGVLPFALDALTRTMVRRGWSDKKITQTLDAVFPDRDAHRYIVVHGRVPTDRTEMVAWVREVQKTYRPIDAVALRRAIVSAGLTRGIARREFPDARLATFYSERGDVPEGTDIDEIKRWVLAPGALAPSAATASLRDDLEVAGWQRSYIDNAIRRLTEGGTDNV